MPVQIDESWEYWVADGEVEESLRDHNERVVRASKNAANREDGAFFFSFAGNSDFDTGRFYDGISMGKMAVSDWFRWDVFQKNKNHYEIIGLFEKALADIERQNRTDWLARHFVAAWNKLPSDLSSTLTALLMAAPPEKEPGTPGAPPGVTGVVANQFGVSRPTIWRRYHRARFAFLTECIPDEFRPKCACGCGMPTAIAYTTNGIFGHKIGKATTFITGHNGKLKRPVKAPNFNGVELVLSPAATQVTRVEAPELPAPPPVAKVERCPYCGGRHMAACSRVKSIEYFENGQVKRVELHEK